MKHNTLMEAQLSAYPDSIMLNDHQMHTALQLEVPDSMDYYKLEEWGYYEYLKKDEWLAKRLFEHDLKALIEQTRARWARSALLYKWQTPEGFFYACSRKPDGSYRFVGFRYWLEESQYASGFDGMGYTPREIK